MRFIQFGQSWILFWPFTTQLWRYSGPISYRKTSSITRGKSSFVQFGLFLGSFLGFFLWFLTIFERLIQNFDAILDIQENFIYCTIGQFLAIFGHFRPFSAIWGHLELFWVIWGHFASFWAIMSNYEQFWLFLAIFNEFLEINNATLTLFGAFIVQEKFIYHKG